MHRLARPGFANYASPGARSATRSLGPLVVLLATTGCATTLRDKPVTALTLRVAGDARVCPGQTTALIINAHLSDGSVLVSEGAGRGDVPWTEFEVGAVGATVQSEGIVTVDGDPRSHLGRPVSIGVRAAYHRNLRAAISLPVRFDCAFVANFDGVAGATGNAGMDGFGGIRGSNGYLQGQRGGSGGRGYDGSGGGPGGRGQAALPVHVTMTTTVIPQTGPLVEVTINNTIRQQAFLIDLRGGALLITANGGAGGQGGQGGAGGRGGAGGSGGPGGMTGSSGLDGFGGHGGGGGDGGDGGTIWMHVDPSAQPFLSRVRVMNAGGAGGEAGRAGLHGIVSGASGRPGRPGPPVQVIAQPIPPLF